MLTQLLVGGKRGGVKLTGRTVEEEPSMSCQVILLHIALKAWPAMKTQHLDFAHGIT
jgi:hypothetical protein